MNSRFPDKVRDSLLASGWTPGRSAPLGDLPSDFVLFPAAESVLREFGGLRVGGVGPGQECATSDLLVQPAAGEGLSDHTGLTTPNGTMLFPMGEFHHGHGYLLIDERGAIYSFFDAVEFYASSFERALSQLVLGLHPEQQTGVSSP
jgi:hypothetical protein